MSIDARTPGIEMRRSAFADPSLERQFRESKSEDALALIRLCAVAVGGAAALFAIVDFKVLGFSPEFDLLLLLRTVVFAASVGVFVAARPPCDQRKLEKLATAYVLLLVFAAPAIQHLRPDVLPTVLPIVVFLTLGIYLFYPGDFGRACALGVLIGAALIGETLSRSDTAIGEVLLGLAITIIANVFGAAAGYRVRVSERRQFAGKLALETALGKIGETERAQAMFVAMLSHDLRNYLNGIVGTSQIMLGADDDSSWRRQTRTIAEMSRNLVRLLDDALDMLRARQADLKIEVSEFDLGRTIANVTGPLRARAEAKGLKFDVRVSPYIPSSLEGDEFRIVQIVGNLVSNAIQYTPLGQVGIEISPVGDEDPPTRIRFSVTDTGPALSAEESAGLFLPAARLGGGGRNARTAGLNLYICKVLIDRLGGTIEVKSEAGVGNKFIVELNFVARAKARAKTLLPGLDEAPARVLTVLAVDDSPVNLEIIEVSLRRLGHVVVTARDGDSALRVARAQAFDVALVDLRMPGMSGEELAAALRSDPAVAALGPVPLIVAVTAETFVDLSPGQAPDGFDGLLSKPIDLVEMSRYLGLARNRAGASGPANDGNGRSAAAIDWERLSELKRDLDRGGLDRVMTTGRSFVEQSLGRLDRAINEAKKEETMAVAHSLKGAAANIALASVARAAIDIEGLAREGDFEGAKPRLAELMSEVPSVLSAVDAWMGRPAQPRKP